MKNGMLIWVDDNTGEELKKVADQNGRTVVGQIRWMLKKLAETQVEEMNISSDCAE